MSEEFENVGGPTEPTGPTLEDYAAFLETENARLRAALERCLAEFKAMRGPDSLIEACEEALK